MAHLDLRLALVWTTVVLALSLLPSVSEAQVYNPTTDHWYSLTPFVTPDDGREIAAIVGGTLVAVNDEAEQQWLVDTFGLAEDFWIGLSDSLEEGTFVWDSGEPLDYENWMPGQPDDGPVVNTQDEVLMVGSAGGQWDDAFVTFRRAIIETDGPLPAPVTALVCEPGLEEATLSWDNPSAYSVLEIYRDFELLATLPGDTTSYVDTSASPPLEEYHVVGYDGPQASLPTSCVTLVTNPAYTLRVGSGVIVVPQTASVPVVIDHQVPGVQTDAQGWSFGVCHDPAVAEIVEVLIGADAATVNGGGPPDFYSVLVLPEGYAVGVVVSFAIFVLPAGLDQELNVGVYGALAPPPAETTLEICETLGTPPVAALVVTNGQSYLPVLENGVLAVAARKFIRTDCDGDAVASLVDVIFLANYLFVNGAVPPCVAACDADADDHVGLNDVIVTANFLFASGPPPAEPFPDCGEEPSPGELDCEIPLCP